MEKRGDQEEDEMPTIQNTYVPEEFDCAFVPASYRVKVHVGKRKSNEERKQALQGQTSQDTCNDTVVTIPRRACLHVYYI